ncbi:hypothetical protein B1207_14115 [Legionella quinlivanii]|uniref:Uncharacterized protein n=1 Tax=Legionella quinlivanii TaxID=45073 RepID=A0A364LG05_9GAMM|nr:hypothetical protein [Legionella quinlivanii]RAP35030.1 hypothetical protein B1207_14115 [Legionella quinlivanii]
MLSSTLAWWNIIVLTIKEFFSERVDKPQFEIVDLYECSKTKYTKAVIKLSQRHIIEKNISDIVVDNNFIECLDKKTVRTLTYIATVERLKPDYTIITQQMRDEVEGYMLELKSKNGRETITGTPTEISRDKDLISKLNPIDANRVGYMAGVSDTVKDYKNTKAHLEK